MEFEEFTKNCDNNVCLRGTIINEKTCQKDYKRKNCHRKYLIVMGKKEAKLEEMLQKRKEIIPNIDEKWVKVRENVFKRDKYKCQLLAHLEKSANNLEYFNAKALVRGTEDSVDPAHIFGKGAFGYLKYCEENILSLNHLFHMSLDHYRHPINGKEMTRDERNEYMLNLIPKDRKERLLKKKLRQS